ncbi:MAG TPA: hypothetical protein VMW27_06580 [Thermoanaerobaculia bacterium]|nr:hypothetical protein [Thermoanaerobaculia bacterium]
MFEDLGVHYLLGGSLASSLHGIPRTTQDADLVAALEHRHVPLLVEALQRTFYMDADRMRDAIRRQASFNLIHLSTLTKVDIFVYKADPFSRSEMERRQQIELPGGEGSSLLVASAEDTVLQKLRWYVLGGGTSERQWNDILGVLKVRRASLDLPYLRRWAAELELTSLFAKALLESGLED